MNEPSFDITAMAPEEIVAAMSALKSSMGWLILMGIVRDGDLINANMALRRNKFTNVQEVADLQTKIEYIEHLIGLPDELIAEYSNTDKIDTIDDGDPYDPNIPKTEDPSQPTGQQEAE